MNEIKQNDQTFNLFHEGQKAGFIEYNKKNDSLLEITHTEVAEEFGGKGLGKELVKAVVDYAKENDFKIVSSCPYAEKIMAKTAEFKEVLVE